MEQIFILTADQTERTDRETEQKQTCCFADTSVFLCAFTKIKKNTKNLTVNSCICRTY